MKLGVSQRACTKRYCLCLRGLGGGWHGRARRLRTFWPVGAGLGRDHQVARCLRVLRHVWTAGGAVVVAAAVLAARAALFKGGPGRGGAVGVQKTVEILQVPFDRVCLSSCEQRQVSTELQFLDKVVDELVLCNDTSSKGFAHRQGRRRASGHASVYGCF